MYLRQKENKGKNINNRAESCYCQKKEMAKMPNT